MGQSGKLLGEKGGEGQVEGVAQAERVGGGLPGGLIDAGQAERFDLGEGIGGEPVRAEAIEPKPSRKASSETCVTVPQTDTGRRVENTEGIGRTSVKELGKIAP